MLWSEARKYDSDGVEFWQQIVERPVVKGIKMERESTGIVITSINEPTVAIRKHASAEDSILYVVGDRKTEDRAHKSGQYKYLSYEEQLNSEWRIAKLLRSDHYCRKNIGYLEAISAGHKYIYDTDDDNIPITGRTLPLTGKADILVKGGQRFINAYSFFSTELIWPRGFPLDEIKKGNLDIGVFKEEADVGIWQGLADGDPDVDAIFRLVLGKEIVFKDNDSFCLDYGSYCPINSQNTMFGAEVAELMYLPSHVSFRFTDILRGYIAQAILWRLGKRVGFCNATVLQIRNEHDLMKDFRDEIVMYEHTKSICDIIEGSVSSNMSIAEMLVSVYEALEIRSVVGAGEVEIVNSWIKDVSDCRERALKEHQS